MCEYRVLSSAMMKDEATLSKVWDGVMRSIQAFNEGYNRPSYRDVIECINSSNVAMAKQLIHDYNLEFEI